MLFLFTVNQINSSPTPVSSVLSVFEFPLPSAFFVRSSAPALVSVSAVPVEERAPEEPAIDDRAIAVRTVCPEGARRALPGARILSGSICTHTWAMFSFVQLLLIGSRMRWQTTMAVFAAPAVAVALVSQALSRSMWSSSYDVATFLGAPAK
jgi:hypothetical protein